MSYPLCLKPAWGARALETSPVWTSKIVLLLNLVLVVQSKAPYYLKQNSTVTNGKLNPKTSWKFANHFKGLFTRCDLSCRFVGPEKSWSKSARVNGDPMRARFQSDMSADSEKICDRFTDFPASGPILQPKRTYPFAKWRTLKVNLLGKKGRLMKRRSTFLYHSGRNIPAFLTKLIPTTKTKTNGTLLGNKLQNL